MTTSDRDKFLQSVERQMILLGHKPSEWKKDGAYSCCCTLCGLVVTAKVGLKISDLPEAQCQGKSS